LDEKIGENQSKVDDLVGSLAEVATSGSYNDLADTPSLAKVATSGDYNDLDYKPFQTVQTVEELIKAVKAMDDNGGIIYILPGEYEFPNSSLYIQKDNVILIGSGANTTLKLNIISVIGNNVAIKNLKLTNDASAYNFGGLISLNAVNKTDEGRHAARNFELSGVFADFDKNTTSSLPIAIIGVDGDGEVVNTKILNCTFAGDYDKLFSIGSSSSISGIINNCWSESAMTAPSTMTLGTNINITASEEA
jgi:hypothetical protein